MLLRPNLKGSNNTLDFILNTFPNFIGGLVFTFLCYDFFLLIFKKKFKLISFIVIFFWLTLEEYYPIFSHNIYFDYNDIIMSFIGGLITLFVIYYD